MRYYKHVPKATLKLATLPSSNLMLQTKPKLYSCMKDCFCSSCANVKTCQNDDWKPGCHRRRTEQERQRKVKLSDE